MSIVSSESNKTWYGEPAALKGLLGTILTVALALLNGETTAADGLLDVLNNVSIVLVPILTGLWTRQSVTPVASSTLPAGAE